MRWSQPAKLVDLNLKGMKSLLLVVGDARDGINCDHADWADAKFEEETKNVRDRCSQR